MHGHRGARRKNVEGLEILAVLTALLGLLALFGYAYDLEPFYVLPSGTAMAVHTAVCFLVLSIGILSARQAPGIVATLTGTSAGSILARRLMPAALLVPASCGWFQVFAQRHGYLSPATAGAVQTIGTILLFMLLLWRGARELNARECELRKAQEELKRGVLRRDELVRERTAQLAQSEARYRALAENSHDLIMRYDHEGRFLYVNAACANIVGAASAAFLGKTHQELKFPRALCSLWDATIARVFETRQPQGEVFEIEGARGKVVLDWRLVPEFGESGSVETVLGVSRDVTKQVRAERERRQAERMYQDLVETSQGLIWRTDAEGRFTYLSPAWEATLGYGVGEMLGRCFTEFQPPEVVEREFAEFARHRAGESARGYETVYIARGGREVPVVLNGMPIRDDDGAIVGAQGTAFDLTELKKVERERREVEEQFRQAQKMEAIGTMAGGIAHDFNNLLMTIMGYADLLQKALPKESPFREYTQTILSAGGRAAGLTHQLLAFSRRHTFIEEVLDLGLVVAQMQTLIRPLIREDIRIVVDSAPNLWSVEADRGEIEQVLMNLTVNARDAIEGPGTITFRTGNYEAERSGGGVHPSVPPGRYVALEVADSGCGMDESVKARIFEPFFTTKPEGEGTGLGLSTVFGIVKQSRGHLEVESRVGAGTSFTVFLPAAAAEPPSRPGTDAALHETASGGETILLVEDEDAVRFLVKEVLRELGYRVLEASGPGEALELVAGGKRRLDLLLTDVVMPEMSGPELAHKVRALHPDVRLLFMSGYPAEALAKSGLAEIGGGFLRKPVTPDELAKEVRAAIEGADEATADGAGPT